MTKGSDLVMITLHHLCFEKLTKHTMKMILNYIEHGHFFCVGEEGKEVVKGKVINDHIPCNIQTNLNFPKSEHANI